MKYRLCLIFALLLPFIINTEDLCAQNVQGPNSADPNLRIPIIQTSNLEHYAYDRLDYGMTIGIERTKKGRIWACWVGGGDSEDAFFVLATSDNEGRSFSSPRAVIDPHVTGATPKVRTLVGALWTDPLGRLWLFFDQGSTHFDGRLGNWYSICENPDSDSPKWSVPIRIADGCTLNKPIVLSNGHWILPVSLWDREKIKAPFKDDFKELDSLRMANVYRSTDQGRTWARQGGVRFPKPQFDEHVIVERKDGSLWMTARTLTLGIYQSSSFDEGKTWTEPTKFLEHINSRHLIIKLKSGRLLMVKHGDLNERTKVRSKLTAYLSEDEGKTWIGKLILDERRGVSYPDGFQAPNGEIFVSYDHNRDTDGEILMARFNEEDILAGRFTSKRSKLKILIVKPLGLDKLVAPSDNR